MRAVIEFWFGLLVAAKKFTHACPVKDYSRPVYGCLTSFVWMRVGHRSGFGTHWVLMQVEIACQGWSRYVSFLYWPKAQVAEGHLKEWSSKVLSIGELILWNDDVAC